MQQQINLYQRPRRTRSVLSAQSLLLSLAVVSGVLLSIWSYGQHTVTRLQQQVDAYQQQQAEFSQLMAAGDSLLAAKITPAALQQQVNQLTQTLTQRQQALQLLQARSPVTRLGFATRLTALAHPHVAGVWLEGVTLDATPGIQSLSGRSLNATLVAGYLRALAAEPALLGTHFDVMHIHGAKYVDKDLAATADSPVMQVTQAPTQAETEAETQTAPKAEQGVRFRIEVAPAAPESGSAT